MGQLDFGLIGNCQVSALIDKQASVVWACLPRFDSPSLFASLIDHDESGTWQIEAVNGKATEQRYSANTNVLETYFENSDGEQFVVFDFCPRFRLGSGKIFHPAEMVRVIRPLSGSPKVRMILNPRFAYGKRVPEVESKEGEIIFQSEEEKVFLGTTASTKAVLESTPFTLSEEHGFILTHGQSLNAPVLDTAHNYLERTTAYWRRWVKHGRIPSHYQSEVIRSALALKLHVYEETGAIIAATTTSLPESPDGGRNWDYRYCWLRDAYFVIHSLNRLGQIEEMESYIHYLARIKPSDASGRLQPVYGIGWESELVEREISRLAGFKGLGPVRVGNQAYTHDQHDVYGEMVLAMAPMFFDARLEGDRRAFYQQVVSLVEKAIEVFEIPDAGIWEMRSEQKHYVFSKVMCWAAVDRGVRIAKKMRDLPRQQKWSSVLGAMREEIETQGWDETEGCYGQYYGTGMPDASNLLMTAVNFHPKGHPRIKQMVESYQKTLLKDGFVFRYLNRDDFGVPRHAFTVCTFWYIDALASIGKVDEARELFENVLSCTNHLGLLSEDINQENKELWGNFPQTYSHVGIINSAFRLSPDWDDTY